MAHARRGSGPTLIDCKPWVLPGQKPAKGRATHDPILRMEEYLTRKGLFDKKFKSKDERELPSQTRSRDQRQRSRAALTGRALGTLRQRYNSSSVA